jgi:hypothetical protein
MYKENPHRYVTTQRIVGANESITNRIGFSQSSNDFYEQPGANASKTVTENNISQSIPNRNIMRQTAVTNGYIPTTNSTRRHSESRNVKEGHDTIKKINSYNGVKNVFSYSQY